MEDAMEKNLPAIDDASYITVILLKTGGNMDVFARWQKDSKNPEWNRLKYPLNGCFSENGILCWWKRDNSYSNRTRPLDCWVFDSFKPQQTISQSIT